MVSLTPKNFFSVDQNQFEKIKTEKNILISKSLDRSVSNGLLECVKSYVKKVFVLIFGGNYGMN